jgi:hypothetical protein
MKPSREYVYRWASILGATAFGLAAFARAELAHDSPFIPVSSAITVPGGESSGTLELRGIMSSDAGLEYCIYDRTKKSSTWVQRDEPGFDFIVKSGNSLDESVILDYQGRTLKLVLRYAKVSSSGQGLTPSPNGVASALPFGTDATRTPDANREPTEEEQNQLRTSYGEVHRRLIERQALLTAKNPALSVP